MPRRQDPRDLSSAAQEYLLALRVMAADGTEGHRGPGCAAPWRHHAGRKRDVPPARCRRARRTRGQPGTATDHGRPRGRRHDLPAPRADRMAADVGRRARLGRVGRGGDAPPGRDLAPGRGSARRDARSPRDVPARQSHRRRDCGAPSQGHPAQRDRGRRAGHRLPHHRGGRGGRRPAVVPRGPGAPPRCPHHGPRSLRIAQFAHARGSAGARHAGTASRRARPCPPRGGRSGALPHGADRGAEGPRPRTC